LYTGMENQSGRLIGGIIYCVLPFVVEHFNNRQFPILVKLQLLSSQYWTKGEL
jgi:hypothetical protein